MRKSILYKNDALEEAITEFCLAPEAGLNLADPKLVSYYKDYNNRCLYISKEINSSLFDEIRSIIQWNREDEEKNIPPEKRLPIVLMIHSYGGDLDSCYALLDVMNLSKTPIYTVNLQCAMSCGCLILINGHKRYCMPMSQALIHSGSGETGGSFEQCVAQTDNYKKLINMMQDNIISHTKIDLKTLRKWKGKETYLYAADQIEYGIVDEVLSDLSKIL